MPLAGLGQNLVLEEATAADVNISELSPELWRLIKVSLLRCLDQALACLVIADLLEYSKSSHFPKSGQSQCLFFAPARIQERNGQRWEWDGIGDSFGKGTRVYMGGRDATE